MASAPPPSPPGALRRLGLDDLAMAAEVHRESYDARLPWLAGQHDAAAFAGFWREHLFPAFDLWGWHSGDALLGVMALQPGRIDQLFVAPAAQRLGIGSRLLTRAQAGQDVLELWTFERNLGARAFYEAHGFVAVEYTDGRRNEEREPDVRYRWVRG